MKSVSLSGSPRENVGKKDAAKLRAGGRVPCVIYGGEEQLHFHIDEVKLNKLVFSPDVYKIDLDIDGKKIEAVMVDMQWHPVTDAVLHVDFLQLVEGKEIKLKMPVQIAGNSIGVRNGGKLRVAFRKVTLQGQASDFPDAVNVDITELRIGEAVRVRDIDLKNVQILEPQESVVVQVKTARGVVADDEEEGEGEEEAAPAEEA